MGRRSKAAGKTPLVRSSFHVENGSFSLVPNRASTTSYIRNCTVSITKNRDLYSNQYCEAISSKGPSEENPPQKSSASISQGRDPSAGRPASSLRNLGRFEPDSAYLEMYYDIYSKGHRSILLTRGSIGVSYPLSSSKVAQDPNTALKPRNHFDHMCLVTSYHTHVSRILVGPGYRRGGLIGHIENMNYTCSILLRPFPLETPKCLPE